MAIASVTFIPNLELSSIFGLKTDVRADPQIS